MDTLLNLQKRRELKFNNSNTQSSLFNNDTGQGTKDNVTVHELIFQRLDVSYDNGNKLTCMGSPAAAAAAAASTAA